MADADLIVPLFLDQDVLLEDGLSVTAVYTSREAAVGGFDVAVAMVNTDDVDPVHYFHIHSSLSF